MLQLTKRTEYGLIALSLLAERQGEVLSVREVCERFPVPRRLLAEVLKDLAREGLIESHRGATGGYSLGRSPGDVTVGEIIAVLEGRPSLASCESLGAYVAGSCEVEQVCPIKSPIQRLRGDLWSLLERTTLDDLIHPTAAARIRGLSQAQ